MSASSNPNIDSVLDAIQHVVGFSSKEHSISLHEPDFSGTKAWDYVRDCLDTGWVSTAGRWVSPLSKSFANLLIQAIRWS